MNLKVFFKPATMAVVGVSLRNDQHPANVIYTKNRLRYDTRAYPVSDRPGIYQGERVYGRLSEIPEKIDLLVIAARAEKVPDLLAEGIEAGAGGAVIISAGFAETGRKEIQDGMVSMARAADFPFVGPNCIGIYSPPWLDTFFIPSERLVRPERGNIAIVSQSGGLLIDQMIRFAGQSVGLSSAISIGNKAMIGELDLLRYFAEDPETEVIAFYIEGFDRNEGRRFVQACRECSKPVIVLKSGKTPGGTEAISSHTASLAGDYDVFSSALAQHGIVEARNEFQLTAFSEVLSCYRTAIDGRIGILSVSGGHGVLATDACSAAGLPVPVFSEGLQGRLREKASPRIQSIASFRNPVDLTGSAVDEDFFAVAHVLSDSPEIDCVILLLLPYVPGITSDLGARLSQVYRQKGKPFIAYVPHVEKYRMLIEGFELNRIPVAHSIEEVVYMADALRRRKRC